MLLELRSEGINDVQIIGINGIEFASKPLSGMIEGRMLPWVQDNFDQHVWQFWEAYIRDFFVLNHKGETLDVFNLTGFNPDPAIKEGENYRIIKNLLLSARKQ